MLAEGPSVAREKKYFSPFGPAVWPARGNIYMNILFYYKDIPYPYIQYPTSLFHISNYI